MDDSREPVMRPHPDKVAANGCISLIGMAASGKTTLGRELGKLIGWGHIDTDHIIEAVYGAKLQQITDILGKEKFLDAEAKIIQSLVMRRMVISTGGSVIYRQEAVACIAGLGPLVYIDVPLPIILERIARKPDRGLAINPGQSIEDLYNERQELYRKAAHKRFTGSEAPAADLALEVAEWLCSPGPLVQ